MIWTPHTPIFGLKTILAQNWTTKLKKSGQNRPFGALAAEMEAQYIPVSTYNIPDSRQLMDGGHLAYWDPGPHLGCMECLENPRGPQKGSFAQNGAPGVP